MALMTPTFNKLMRLTITTYLLFLSTYFLHAQETIPKLVYQKSLGNDIVLKVKNVEIKLTSVSQKVFWLKIDPITKVKKKILVDPNILKKNINYKYEIYLSNPDFTDKVDSISINLMNGSYASANAPFAPIDCVVVNDFIYFVFDSFNEIFIDVIKYNDRMGFSLLKQLKVHTIPYSLDAIKLIKSDDSGVILKLGPKNYPKLQEIYSIDKHGVMSIIHSVDHSKYYKMIKKMNLR